MAYKDSLPYDKTDPISIYEYALPLIGHTLREIVGDAAVAGYNSKNKGELGQMVEKQITHPDATNDQQKHLEILLPCTIRNYPNRLNHQIDFSSSRKSANEWYGEYLLSSECTLVHCLGRSSTLRASVTDSHLCDESGE